jgi:hypothetical protein
VARSIAFFLLSVALTAQPSAEPSAQGGSLDPAFQKIPFDQWLSARDQGPFRWTVTVPRPELSFHQRLVALVDVKLDGKDLESRRGDGQLVFFVQITDRDGKRYQNHRFIDLSKLDENIKSANLEYSERAFVLPGEFQAAVAILDTATGEHSARQVQFRVPAPSHDALASAWRDLPSVEFLGSQESPDGWYLPNVHGRLQWADLVKSKAQINIILNVAVSVPVPRSHQTPSGDLSALLPTLKAITQPGSPALSEHVQLLDLARRKAVFDQSDVRELDWPRLKSSLSEANTASIDVRSLAQRHHDAQFFVSQVRGLLRASEKPCVLVVLTAPVAFDSGEDLEPISLEGLTTCHVVYIRYRARQMSLAPFAPQMGAPRRARMGSSAPGVRPAPETVDQLEATLKPLSPKVFDVSTAEQVSSAIADMRKALLANKE